jgi:hypothetical protein
MPFVVKNVVYITISFFYQDEGYSRPLLKCQDTLTRFEFGTDDMEIPYLLEKNTFSKLQTLSLSPIWYDAQQRPRGNLQLLDCLMHAPSLRKLNLEDCQIMLSFLEKMRTDCEALEQIIFERVLFVSNGDDKPQHIMPANQLLHLELDFESAICDQHCIYLSYLVQKRPNLKHLNFLSSFEDDDFEDLIQRLSPMNGKTSFYF